MLVAWFALAVIVGLGDAHAQPEMASQYLAAADVWQRAADATQCAERKACALHNASYYRCVAKAYESGAAKCTMTSQECAACAADSDGGGAGAGAGAGAGGGSSGYGAPATAVDSTAAAIVAGAGTLINIWQAHEAASAAETERQRQIAERNMEVAREAADLVSGNRSAHDYPAFTLDMQSSCRISDLLELEGYEPEPRSAIADTQALRSETALYNVWRASKDAWTRWVVDEQPGLTTALAQAVTDGQPAQAALLLQAGGRPDVPTALGHNAFDLAMGSDNLDLKIEFLLAEFSAPAGLDRSFTAVPVGPGQPPVSR